MEFFYFLIFYKCCALGLSYHNTRYISFVDKSGSWGWLLLFYLAYFVVVLVILDASLIWAQNELVGTESLAATKLVLSFIVIDLGVYIISASAIAWAITFNLTRPEFIPEEPSFDYDDEE